MTGYVVLRGPDATSLEVLVDDTGSTNPWYVDTEVTEDTTYAYAVKAISGAGTSGQSNVVEIATLEERSVVIVEAGETEDPPVARQQGHDDPPPAPYYMWIFAFHDSVTVAWSCRCSTASGFSILRGPNADALDVLVEDTGSTLPRYTDSDVTPDTTYVYSIKSLNDNGESTTPRQLSVTTPAAPATNILVSNMGERLTSAGFAEDAFVGGGVAAQKFTTGGHEEGYNLEGVYVDIFREGAHPIDPKVSIFAAGEFLPSTVAHELTGPERDVTVPASDTRPETLLVGSHAAGAGREYYAAPTGATLAANTSYMVVFEQGSATDQTYERSYYTAGNPLNEGDHTKADGWSTGYSLYKSEDTPEGEFQGTRIFSTRRQIAVMGTPVQPMDP